MKKKQKNNNEEIALSILKKNDNLVVQEYEREEVLPLHISAALLFALSKSMASEAYAHNQTYGTDPENRIIKQIDVLRKQTLQDLKERLSHGEE